MAVVVYRCHTSPARQAAIIAAYRAGEKVEAIAAEHGVSDSTVCRLARAAGLPGRTGRVLALARQYLAPGNPYGSVKAAARDQGVNYLSLCSTLSQQRARLRLHGHFPASSIS